jgi:hypothetical protein
MPRIVVITASGNRTETEVSSLEDGVQHGMVMLRMVKKDGAKMQVWQGDMCAFEVRIQGGKAECRSPALSNPDAQAWKPVHASYGL